MRTYGILQSTSFYSIKEVSKMEKTKKRLSKKTVIIGLVVLAVMLVGYGLLYYFANIWEPKEKEKFTFEQITQGLSEKVDHVEYEGITRTQEEIENYYDTLVTHYYVRTSDTGSGELEFKVLFYDENNNLIFFVNVYGYGFIFIQANEYTGTYHFSTQ